MYSLIVAGTDLSRTAHVATDRAAALASRLEARLVLVHAGSDPGGPLEELANAYGAEARAVRGNPVDVLIGASEEIGADLLVVGNVGMSGPRRFLLGNVPNKVSHHAPLDLLIVKTSHGTRPAPGGDAYRRLLVGTDGSDTATTAVKKSAALARAIDAQLLIVCVYDPPSEQELEGMRANSGDVMAQWGAGRDMRDVPEEFRWRIAGAAQAEDVLDRAAEHAGRAGASHETRAVEGSPAEALISLAEAEDFDAIVVGNVGMTGARRLMLGNVPHRISHHAPTDVLILRTS